jgi:hypothetical protein
LPKHCCSGKATNITHSDCVSVALIIQHERRMRRIILPRVACLTQSHFSTLSHNLYDFWEILVEEKIFVLIFSTTSYLKHF